MELELWQLERKYADLRIADRHRLARLVASIAEHGQQQPVLVVRGAGDDGGLDRYVLIDGYARVAALGELKRDTIEATALELSEAHALLLAFRLERNRARSVIEEAWLVRELVITHATPQNELAALLGRSASWVSRPLALVEVLPEVAEQAVRGGALPAQAAMKCLVPLARANRCALTPPPILSSRMKCLVPLARANRGQCEGLVANLESRRLSVREMARLYAAWRAGNAAQREAIVAHPLLYLEMEEKLPALAERFDFHFLAHELGDANRSARVEQPFDFIAGNFYPGRRFTDLDDLNLQFATW